MLEPDCQNEKLCRVCHGVDQVESRLISPCKCNGSMKFVHEKCLLAWLTSTGQFNSKCEICSETFRFEKVYSVKDEKRSISWEIARGFLNQIQTFVKLFIYNFLPIVTWWWFRTSWCLIFTSDPICIRNPPTRMEMLSIFGTGIVQLATVSVWIFFLYLVIDKIYMVRENLLHSSSQMLLYLRLFSL